jgi:SseB protein N-terminal domain
MGLFDWLFRRKRAPEPPAPQDMWNPEGVERLFNEELHQAIETAAADPSSENRRRVFQLLMTIVYCIPSAGGSGEGRPLTITASKNEAGERVLVAFTDPCALKRWATDPPAFLALAAAELFELVLENDFVQVLINPAGPAGGQLSRGDVEQLARGIIPVE